MKSNCVQTLVFSLGKHFRFVYKVVVSLPSLDGFSNSCCFETRVAWNDRKWIFERTALPDSIHRVSSAKQILPRSSKPSCFPLYFKQLLTGGMLSFVLALARVSNRFDSRLIPLYLMKCSRLSILRVLCVQTDDCSSSLVPCSSSSFTLRTVAPHLGGRDSIQSYTPPDLGPLQFLCERRYKWNTSIIDRIHG